MAKLNNSKGKKGKTGKFPSKGKSYQKKFNGNTKSEDRFDIMKERPGKNDISWYGSSELINAAGRLNFTNPLGKPIDWYFDNTGAVTCTLGTNNQRNAESVPGVMSLHVECGIGYTSSAADIANVAFRNIYSWIRHANSGHSNYDTPDLALYFMAVDQIYQHIENLVRVYGVARTYSSANRYMPTAILNAMGVDPYAGGANLYETMADFRSALLNTMVKIGTFVVPKDISLIDRHRSLFTNVFADGTTSKCQTYVFRPCGYKVYLETGSGHSGGYLEHHTVTGVQSVWYWLGIVNTMIDAIVQSQDMNIMSGDILKAYGRENCYQLAGFSEDYTLLPVYNPEMLLEIHNLCLAGTAVSDADFDIYQDPSLNILKYEPVFLDYRPTCIALALDMPVEVPTPEQVLIATRLSHMGSYGTISGGGLKYVPESIGSEVVTLAQVWNYYTNSGGGWTLGNTQIFQSETVSTTAMLDICQSSKFNWHFPVKVFDDTSAPAYVLIGYSGELENYTSVTPGDIRKLHEAALIGEFRVPLVGIDTLKGELK